MKIGFDQFIKEMCKLGIDFTVAQGYLKFYPEKDKELIVWLHEPLTVEEGRV